jgi:hypothetical protein
LRMLTMLWMRLAADWLMSYTSGVLISSILR